MEREVDLIEEIGRIYGLHNIPNKSLVGSLTRGEMPYNAIIKDKAIKILQGLGLNEVMTYSFISPKAYDKIKLNPNSIKRKSVKIINPLGEDYSVMRTTIIPNMMDLLSRNYNHGVKEAFAYEVGNIFIPKNESTTELPLEKMTLTIGMYGNADYFYIKGIIETLLKRLGMEDFRYLREENHPTFHPGRTANIIYNNKVLGVIGEVHPDVIENYEMEIPVYIGELDFDIIVEEANLINKYKPLPKYPSITRDLAVVLDKDIPVANIEDVIKKWGKGIVEEVSIEERKVTVCFPREVQKPCDVMNTVGFIHSNQYKKPSPYYLRNVQINGEKMTFTTDITLIRGEEGWKGAEKARVQQGKETVEYQDRKLLIDVKPKDRFFMRNRTKQTKNDS